MRKVRKMARRCAFSPRTNCESRTLLGWRASCSSGKAHPGGIMKVTRLFAGLGVVGVVGCSAAETNQPAKPIEDAVLTTNTTSGGGGLLTAPDCSSNNYQQHTAYAQPHSPQNPSPAALTQY